MIDPHYNIKQTIFLILCSHCRSESPCVFVESIRHLQTSWGKASIVCCFKKAFIVRVIMFYVEKWQWTYINTTKCHQKFIVITENFSLDILWSEFFFFVSFLVVVLVNKFVSRSLFVKRTIHVYYAACQSLVVTMLNRKSEKHFVNT